MKACLIVFDSAEGMKGGFTPFMSACADIEYSVQYFCVVDEARVCLEVTGLVKRTFIKKKQKPESSIYTTSI